MTGFSGRLLLGAALFLSSVQAQDQLALRSQQAKQLMSQGRFAEAAAIYDELCKALPTNTGLRLNLGMALQMSGKAKDSIPHLETVLKAQPGLLPALLTLASARLQQNEPKLAIPLLEKAVPLDAANPAPRGMLATALLATGRAGEAAPHFRKLTEIAPADPKGWNGLGRAYEAISVQAFEQLSKSAPESAYWFTLLAESRNKQSQNRAAFFFYRKAADKAPKLRGVHAALADIYRRTDHADWAAKEDALEAAIPRLDCKAARSLECDFAATRYLPITTSPLATPEALFWKVRAANQLAVQAFSTLEKLPESMEVLTIVAELHAAQGRHKESANAWDRALTLSGGDPGIRRELAAALIAAKDFSAAQAVIDKLMSQEPSAPDVNFLQGDLLLVQQEAEKAIPFLRIAVAADAKLLPAQAALARALLQTGQGEAAVPHIQAALPLDDDGSMHFQLARAYQAAGKADLAKTAMAKYQEIRSRMQASNATLEEEAQITPP
ncbi:MAG: tetratricopeptide repeat protein [Bryobacteraceae bacterium]